MRRPDTAERAARKAVSHGVASVIESLKFFAQEKDEQRRRFEARSKSDFTVNQIADPFAGKSGPSN
jgi:hypothetical protein